jgi:hypothetical protein
MDDFDRGKWLLDITEKLYTGLHFRTLLSPDKRTRETEDFSQLFKSTYPNISRDDAIDLLSWHNWRPRVVGAYICGFRRWDDFDGCIGRLLVRDELIYSSLAYSFALARFALPSSSTALCAYLWNNFSGLCTDYSSIWHAIAALRWVDERNKTDFYERYVGEWHEKVENGGASLMGHTKEESRELMRLALSKERVEGAEKQLRELMKVADRLAAI